MPRAWFVSLWVSVFGSYRPLTLLSTNHMEFIMKRLSLALLVFVGVSSASPLVAQLILGNPYSLSLDDCKNAVQYERQCDEPRARVLSQYQEYLAGRPSNSTNPRDSMLVGRYAQEVFRADGVYHSCIICFDLVRHGGMLPPGYSYQSRDGR